jgi:AraC-like DNA-binding protein
VNLAEDVIRVYDPAEPSTRSRSGAVVFGTHTRSFFIDPRQRVAAIGAHFRPGRAFPFLGISPSEIVDTHVDLGDVWGSLGWTLRERLLEVEAPERKLCRFEAILLERFRRARMGHPSVELAVAALWAPGRAVRVAEVASSLGLSHRRFVELFERDVGLTPKLYARLQRFHHVKQRIAALGGPPSWAAFALECGYSDQSHMIRDFADFSGMSPSSYLRGGADQVMFDHLVHAYPRRPGVSRLA